MAMERGTSRNLYSQDGAGPAGDRFSEISGEWKAFITCFPLIEWSELFQ